MVVHFTPVPNESGPAWFRVSTCGVTTRIGSSVAGSSNLKFVTCPDCLKRVVPWSPTPPPITRPPFGIYAYEVVHAAAGAPTVAIDSLQPTPKFFVRYYDAKLSKKGQGSRRREFHTREEAETFASQHRYRARPCIVEEYPIMKFAIDYTVYDQPFVLVVEADSLTEAFSLARSAAAKRLPEAKFTGKSRPANLQDTYESVALEISHEQPELRLKTLRKYVPTLNFVTEVPEATLANVICSAVEAGIAYWAERLWFSGPPGQVSGDWDGHWERYFRPLQDGKMCIVEREVSEPHEIGREDFIRALKLLAHGQPNQFAAILSEKSDARTADILIQLACFGRIVYQ